ncbi:hypothetical protein ES705_44263 [subsurface metagenome]
MPFQLITTGVRRYLPKENVLYPKIGTQKEYIIVELYNEVTIDKEDGTSDLYTSEFHLVDRGTIIGISTWAFGGTMAINHGLSLDMASLLYLTESKVSKDYWQGQGVAIATLEQRFRYNRFIGGLWIPFDDDDYLKLLSHWSSGPGCERTELQMGALVYAVKED